MRKSYKLISTSLSFSTLRELHPSDKDDKESSRDEVQPGSCRSVKYHLRELKNTSSSSIVSRISQLPFERTDDSRIVISTFQNKQSFNSDYSFKFEIRQPGRKEYQVAGIAKQIGDAQVFMYVKKQVQNIIKAQIAESENVENVLQSVFNQLQQGCKTVENAHNCGCNLLLVVMDSNTNKVYVSNLGSSLLCCNFAQEHRQDPKIIHQPYQALVDQFLDTHTGELEQRRSVLDALQRADAGGCIGFLCTENKKHKLNFQKLNVVSFNIQDIRYFFFCSRRITDKILIQQLQELVESCITDQHFQDHEFQQILAGKQENVTDSMLLSPKSSARSTFDTASRQQSLARKTCQAITKYAFTKGAEGNLAFGLCILSNDYQCE